MHGWGTRMRLKYYLEQGVSKSELSRRFGIARRTIHHWMRRGNWTATWRPGRRGGRRGRGASTSWTRTRGSSRSGCGSFPKLSAARLFEEVRAAGYPGGYGRVNEYVRQVRPRDPVEPLQRFETPPGRQGQVDFGTFKLPWGRRHALLVVLGHSRLLWLRFYPRQTMTVLIDGLESAFARFGGVPQELLFDQMRSVVISDDRTGGGGLVLNAEFLRFCGALGLHGAIVPASSGHDEG